MGRVVWLVCGVGFSGLAQAACPWEGSASTFFRCMMDVSVAVDENRESTESNTSRLDGIEEALWDLSDDLAALVDSMGSGGGSGVMRGHYHLTNSIDLANLVGFTEITGDLTITSGPGMENMVGLESLTAIGGTLYIQNNPSLVNLEGLSNLTSVGGGFYVSSNDEMTSVDGLEGLTSVGARTSFYANPSLTNVDALANLTVVEGNLDLEYNEALTDLDGLSSLVTVGERFLIQNNHVLTQVDGVSVLESVGSLNIQYNESLCQSSAEALMARISIAGTSETSDNNDGC
jgi:hypothetical protein